MKFEIHNSDPNSQARTGTMHTDHGQIQTPIFMPVGTLGTVKTLRNDDLKDTVDAQIILGNTYHLYMRPGMEVIEKAGGLHGFMNWDLPLLTDSGGYQVYSLASSRKIKEAGVEFKSHIDGSKHFFTPEYAIDVQKTIGADIIMAFDECIPHPCDKNYAKKSTARTHRWLKRCIKRMNETESKYGYNQYLAPIVQGGTYKDLRSDSAKYIADAGCSINAIGGLSVGEPAEVMYEMTNLCCEQLPVEKPRYLMGVGTPVNLIECVALGIDMFDCVLPSRNARHGVLYTWEGIINIKNAKWGMDFSPIDINSKSPLSQIHTKSYLKHLVRVNEMLGKQIATMHNLTFYLELMETMRNEINKGTFSEWKAMIIPKLQHRL